MFPQSFRTCFRKFPHMFPQSFRAVSAKFPLMFPQSFRTCFRKFPRMFPQSFRTCFRKFPHMFRITVVEACSRNMEILVPKLVETSSRKGQGSWKASSF